MFVYHPANHHNFGADLELEPLWKIRLESVTRWVQIQERGQYLVSHYFTFSDSEVESYHFITVKCSEARQMWHRNLKMS